MRELHWHATAAEWAFVLKGRVRTTVINPAGQTETNDFEPGDIWYFPRGHAHVLECLGNEPTHFILIFDNGYFSEFGTFSITDWIGHAPKPLLAKNFGLPESAFDGFPKEEVYFARGAIPPEQISENLQGPRVSPPETHKFRMLADAPHGVFKGGREWRIDSSRFPISTTITGVILDLEPGALRELHWHPNADEWQYYIKGKGRMGIFIGGGKARTMDFEKGDVGYLLKSVPHWIENTGDEDLEFLEMFKSDFYEDLSLGEWISHLPPELVQAHLRMDPKAIASVPKQKLVVVPT
jgi:oxalate decarboxylase